MELEWIAERHIIYYQFLMEDHLIFEGHRVAKKFIFVG